MSEEKQKALEAAGWRVGDAETFVGGCGACVVVGHNAPDGVLPDAPIYRRQPRPEGCEDCSGCPDCYTNEKPCDCVDMSQDFDATVKLTEADPVAAEAMSRQDEELAKRVYGNCKLSNPDVTRKMGENAVDGGPSPPPYHNPLATLRRERKVKSGKAAKLLGISRQRLHVVEHATKPLRCMDRLLAKAAMVWPVVDETTARATPTVMAKELGLSRKESH